MFCWHGLDFLCMCNRQKAEVSSVKYCRIETSGFHWIFLNYRFVVFSEQQPSCQWADAVTLNSNELAKGTRSRVAGRLSLKPKFGEQIL